MLLAKRDRGAQALVGEFGGMRMSQTTTSGSSWRTAAVRLGPSETAAMTLKPRSPSSCTSQSRRIAESSAIATRIGAVAVTVSAILGLTREVDRDRGRATARAGDADPPVHGIHTVSQPRQAA